MKKITTKQITATALLLALMIISQYFKNLSVYITGPIVNAILIIATIGIGLGSGLLLSIISPITAFFLTGSPLMAGIPLLFPTIMLGNCILVISIHFFMQKQSFTYRLPVGMILGSICKAAFMGIVIVYVLFPLFGQNVSAYLPKPEMLPKILTAAKVTFSITQLATALLGSFLAYLIWIPLKPALKNESSL